MHVAIYKQQNERSQRICEAFKTGVETLGDTVNALDMQHSDLEPCADAAIFYGQAGGGLQILKNYVAAGKNALYVDLGYWKRKTKQDQYGGYHKVSWNTPHPEGQLKFPVKADRFQKLGLQIKHERSLPGKHILLAGLSEKAALVNGYQPYEWERRTIALIKKFTERPIVYRPKPSWKFAKPIPGTIFSSNRQALEGVLQRSYCVVTRHSNVAIDGLAEAIPAFTEHGAAKMLCGSFDQLSILETLPCPAYEKRYELFCKLAYCQWNVEEMASGETWQWYRRMFT